MLKHAHMETVRAALIDPAKAELPRHARVQRALRQLILDGALGAGRRLPATRALALSLGISRDTVEAAYSQLHAEGFVTRRVGSGSFVAAQTDFKKPLRNGEGMRLEGATPSPRLSRRGAIMLAGGGVREQSIPRPFAPGLAETRTFPLPLWERLHRQVLRETRERVLCHGDPQGTESLRQVVADYLNLERGARARADRILVVTSAQQGLALCASVLLDAGDPIFVEDPLYTGARRAFEAAGLNCVPIPVDADGMRVSLLSEQAMPAKAVYLTPSHQYPTGATLSLDRRLAVVEWARKNQAWIIEDDYDSEFHYAGRPTACIQGLDPYDRTIYIGTFTKSLFPGLRLAYMVLPYSLVRPIVVARTLMDGHTAPVYQMVAARFLEGGHFGAYVRNMRKVYAARLECLARELRNRLGTFVETRPPCGGLQMPCLMEDAGLEARLVGNGPRLGLNLVALSKLYLGSAAQPGLLLGFAAYTPDEISDGVRALRDLALPR